MGFSETDSSKCRRHPNQRQTPGVCSSCLREKLTILSTSPTLNRKKPLNNLVIVSNSSNSTSSTPPYSSASSSTTTRSTTTTTTATTTVKTRKSPGSAHRRNGSEAYVSVGMVLNNGLKKSRSVSCAPLARTRLGGANDIINDRFKNCVKGGDDQVENNNSVEGCALKKKNGFLKKLIHTTSKKTKGVLMHSRTMKERSSSHNPSNTTIIATSNTTSISKNKN